METKRLNLTIICKAVYNSGIDVPVDMTLEQAIAYANEHLDEVSLGPLEHIRGSDKLDEDNCDFYEGV